MSYCVFYGSTAQGGHCGGNEINLWLFNIIQEIA